MKKILNISSKDLSTKNGLSISGRDATSAKLPQKPTTYLGESLKISKSKDPYTLYVEYTNPGNLLSPTSEWKVLVEIGYKSKGSKTWRTKHATLEGAPGQVWKDDSKGSLAKALLDVNTDLGNVIDQNTMNEYSRIITQVAVPTTEIKQYIDDPRAWKSDTKQRNNQIQQQKQMQTKQKTQKPVPKQTPAQPVPTAQTPAPGKKVSSIKKDDLIYLQKDWLQKIIRDNGQNFDMRNSSDINDLKNMKTRKGVVYDVKKGSNSLWYTIKFDSEGEDFVITVSTDLVDDIIKSSSNENEEDEAAWEGILQDYEEAKSAGKLADLDEGDLMNAFSMKINKNDDFDDKEIEMLIALQRFPIQDLVEDDSIVQYFNKKYSVDLKSMLSKLKSPNATFNNQEIAQINQLKSNGILRNEILSINNQIKQLQNK